MNKINEKITLFKEFMKDRSFEDSLKCVAKDMRDCYVTKLIKLIYNEYFNEFEILLKKLNPNKNTKKYNNFKFISAYLRNKTHKCSVCGRECFIENDTCSPECQSVSQKVIEKRKRTNMSKYGVENAFQSEYIKNKIKETNTLKYGVSHPKQKNITNYKDLNKDFIIKNFVKDGYIDFKAIEKYFNISHKKFNRLCKEYDLIDTNHINSKWENNLFNSINVNNKIHNDRCLIKPLELDIVIPDYKLAIECDGIYWHCNNIHESGYHVNKTIKAYKKGYQLFHIFENENIEIWKSMINNKLKLNKKIYARRCCVKYVNCEDSKNFLNNNHIEGYKNSEINLGLYYNGNLMQIMTFNKFNNVYILNQFCSLLNITVIGGCSKLLNYFIKNYNPINIIAVCNLRYSLGSVYKILGFEFIKFVKPQINTFNSNGIKDNENVYYTLYDCGYLIFSLYKDDFSLDIFKIFNFSKNKVIINKPKIHYSQRHIAHFENLNKEFIENNFLDNVKINIKNMCIYYNIQRSCALKYLKKFKLDAHSIK